MTCHFEKMKEESCGVYSLSKTLDVEATVNVYSIASTESERSDRESSNRAPNIFRRSEEHTSELQSLMRISSAVFCLKKKHAHTLLNHQIHHNQNLQPHKPTHTQKLKRIK